MSRLDDLLGPLQEGIWEVVVPKGEVTEPLDPAWKKSRINVPSPGTIASYRKGRFHVHETRDEWRVHLDRYDPKEHPLLHLIDDAPLLLMISDTFMTLIVDSRRDPGKDRAVSLSAQRFIWQEEVVFGLLLVLVGIFIFDNPFLALKNLFELAVPLAVSVIALVFLARAFRAGIPKEQRSSDRASGAGLLCAGICAFLLPFGLWVIVVLVLLTVWMTASAIMLLLRVLKGRSAVPEGFYSRMATGIVSLVMAYLLLVSPKDVLALLMTILGVITFLAGLTLSINGMRLRQWMRQTPKA
jgi:uncharacterized membrane protein HdeD (DUF308 family)